MNFSKVVNVMLLKFAHVSHCHCAVVRKSLLKACGKHTLNQTLHIHLCVCASERWRWFIITYSTTMSALFNQAAHLVLSPELCVCHETALSVLQWPYWWPLFCPPLAGEFASGLTSFECYSNHYALQCWLQWMVPKPQRHSPCHRSSVSNLAESVPSVWQHVELGFECCLSGSNGFQEPETVAPGRIVECWT